MNGNYLGVYSTIENPDKNHSGTSPVKKYWFAWEWDTGTVMVQGMDNKMQPMGLPRIIVYAAFDSSYTKDELKSNLPVPPNPVSDDPFGLDATQGSTTQTANTEHKNNRPQLLEDIDEDQDDTQKKKKTSLQQGGNASIKEAEEEAINDFNDGLRSFQQGQRKKAMIAFEKPLLMNIPWLAKHKHMFSEFGTTLRKIKIFGLAMRYHSKALSLSPNETNILFNIARVYICLGDNASAEKCLKTVLQNKPTLKEALLLQKHIDKSK